MNPQDQINQIFLQYLGRAPSPAEMQGFSQAMQSGYLDPIGLTSFLQSSAQYQQSQIPQIAQQYAQQLSPLMQQANQMAMNQGMDAAQQRFAQLGRPDSTGLASSFAQVAGQNAANNSQFVGQNIGGYLGGAYGGLSRGQQTYGQGLYAQGQNNYQGYMGQARLMNQQMSYPGVAGYRNPWQSVNQWASLGSGLLNGAGAGAQAYSNIKQGQAYGSLAAMGA
jgi:hypothetical protein